MQTERAATGAESQRRQGCRSVLDKRIGGGLGKRSVRTVQYDIPCDVCTSCKCRRRRAPRGAASGSNAMPEARPGARWKGPAPRVLLSAFSLFFFCCTGADESLYYYCKTPTPCQVWAHVREGQLWRTQSGGYVRSVLYVSSKCRVKPLAREEKRVRRPSNITRHRPRPGPSKLYLRLPLPVCDLSAICLRSTADDHLRTVHRYRGFPWWSSRDILTP